MKYDSNFPKEVSSSPEDKAGLDDSTKKPWSPASDDDEKYVTVSVNKDEDVYIDSVKVTTTSNVKSVEVIVITKDGKEVRLQYVIMTAKL